MRQPLGRAVLLVPEDLQDAVEEVADILADELNVDELEFAEDASELVRVDAPSQLPDGRARLRPPCAGAGVVPRRRSTPRRARTSQRRSRTAWRSTSSSPAPTASRRCASVPSTSRSGASPRRARRSPTRRRSASRSTSRSHPSSSAQGLVREFVHLVQGRAPRRGPRGHRPHRARRRRTGRGARRAARARRRHRRGAARDVGRHRRCARTTARKTISVDGAEVTRRAREGRRRADELARDRRDRSRPARDRRIGVARAVRPRLQRRGLVHDAAARQLLDDARRSRARRTCRSTQRVSRCNRRATSSV